jgi:hypothetical protein
MKRKLEPRKNGSAPTFIYTKWRRKEKEEKLKQPMNYERRKKKIEEPQFFQSKMNTCKAATSYSSPLSCSAFFFF